MKLIILILMLLPIISQASIKNSAAYEKSEAAFEYFKEKVMNDLNLSSHQEEVISQIRNNTNKVVSQMEIELKKNKVILQRKIKEHASPEALDPYRNKVSQLNQKIRYELQMEMYKVKEILTQDQMGRLNKIISDLKANAKTE